MSVGVLIVDDEDLIRAGLRTIIECQDDLHVTGEATDGTQVLDLVAGQRPDIVLMDVRMPSMNGIAATESLMAELESPPKVIVVTTFENDDYVYRALCAGASGFLLKRSRPEEIVHGIRTVASGEYLLYPSGIRRLAANSAPLAGKVDLPWFGLTERETEVLRLMANGLSNTEIAETLFLGLQTVKTHVGRVLTKLGARDRTQAVIQAYESGFIAPKW